MTIINCTVSVNKSWLSFENFIWLYQYKKKVTCLGQQEKHHLALSVIKLSPTLSASKTSPGSISKKKII
jgi:hypothetical protein